MTVKLELEVLREGIIQFPCEGYALEEFKELDADNREELILRNAHISDVQVNDFLLVESKENR